MFDKKEKTKNKPVEKEDNVRTKTSYSSRFARTPDNKVVLEKTPIHRIFDNVTHSWKKSKGEPTLIPVEKLGFSKSLDSQILVKRVIPSLDTMDGTQELYYLQKIRYQVLERYYWVYLKREGNKIFIKDFMTSVTFECPKTSSDYVDVTKDSGRRIEQKEMMELAKAGKLDGVYNKVLDTQEGQIYGHQVYTPDQKIR
jgi:hypothetical protein